SPPVDATTPTLNARVFAQKAFLNMESFPDSTCQFLAADEKRRHPFRSAAKLHRTEAKKNQRAGRRRNAPMPARPAPISESVSGSGTAPCVRSTVRPNNVAPIFAFPE